MKVPKNYNIATWKLVLFEAKFLHQNIVICSQNSLSESYGRAPSLIFILRNVPEKVLGWGLNVGDIEPPRTGTILAYRSEIVRPTSPKVKYLFATLHKRFRVPISKVPRINTYKVQVRWLGHHLVGEWISPRLQILVIDGGETELPRCDRRRKRGRLWPLVALNSEIGK